jgi:hypothetical protein
MKKTEKESKKREIKPGTLFRAKETLNLYSKLSVKKVFRGDIFMYLETIKSGQWQQQKHFFLNKNGERVHRWSFSAIEEFIGTVISKSIERVEL